ncbi:MAG: CDP-archaeol synthase [Actinomycetota bacterium]
MHFALVARLVILLFVANGAPLLAKAMLGSRFDRPLDGGALFPDGRAWFGASKTIRGVVVALVATSLAAPVLGFRWEVGVIVAMGAIAGDLFSSFIKRRLGLASGTMALGLDQIPESLFPLLASRLLLPVGLLDVLAGVVIFTLGNLAVSRVLFHCNMRDTPY